jgi:hypothetical protein
LAYQKAGSTTIYEIKRSKTKKVTAEQVLKSGQEMQADEIRYKW